MAAIKAIVIAAIITGVIFVTWFLIIPVMIFLLVFGVITLITYAVIQENRANDR